MIEPATRFFTKVPTPCFPFSLSHFVLISSCVSCRWTWPAWSTPRHHHVDDDAAEPERRPAPPRAGVVTMNESMIRERADVQSSAAGE